MSESDPSSKASDRVLSASDAMGSSERRGLDTGDEARDRKDGGGEDGIDSRVSEVGGFMEVSSSSLSEIYTLSVALKLNLTLWMEGGGETMDTYSFVALRAHGRGSPQASR